MALLELQQLQVQRSSQQLLTNINLQLQQGEVLAVVGPNGAGKSTLLQHIAGMQPITSGQLLIQQQSTHTWQALQFARTISFLPQLTRLTFPLSVREVIRLGGLAHQWPQKIWQQQVESSIEQWQLQDLAARDVRFLSGGEQQRVQLARTWLQMQADSCQLWLLDEPFSALDLRHQALAFKHIQQMQQQGKSIVLVVHDLNFARHCSDRVLLLQQGKVVAEGAAEAVLTAAQVSQVFAVNIELQQGYLQWWALVK